MNNFFSKENHEKDDIVYHGRDVYVVIEVIRNSVIQSSLIDNQPDIKILGVFLNKIEAQLFCNKHNIFHTRKIMIKPTIIHTKKIKS